MQTWISRNIIKIGWLSIWIFFGSFVVFTTVETLFDFAQKGLPMKFISPIEIFIYLILNIFFWFGVRGFMLQKNDALGVHIASTIIWLNLFEMIFYYSFAFPLYVETDFQVLLLIATLPLWCVNGIFLVKLADCFKKYDDELGKLGKRIVLWNKISGWLLASVVLFIPGLILGLVGEFFLWRLLAKYKNPSF